MLVVCPTPIGNLDDVTPRQMAALRGADIIACEDSRVTGKLLERLGIERPDGAPRLVSYHDHNEEQRVPALMNALEAGQSVVLVSDAGTPTLSDPGFRLVRAAREHGHLVTVLPGPFAGALALAGSGMPTDRWTFEGFLPTKDGARRTALQRIGANGATAVLYESAKRVKDLLAVIQAELGSVEVCVARELTKVHEEWVWGGVEDVVAALGSSVRGEVVVVVRPGEPIRAADDVDKWLESMIEAGVEPSKIKKAASQACGLSKGEIFERMERLKR